MEASLTAALGLGFLLGLRHALDADHLAAITSLVSEQRGLARSCLIGTFWGIGHTTALVAAGVAVIAAKLSISPQVEQGLERMVALVLIVLGGHVLLRAVSAVSLHRDVHAHDGSVHSHAHLHQGCEASHRHLSATSWRSFLVGLVHGMAGSAALMLIALASIPSVLGQMLYILVFGVGSTGGMLLLSGLIGLPFAFTAGRSHIANLVIRAFAGVASLILGVVMLID